MEPRYNESAYNERFSPVTPIIVKYMKKNLDITKPRYGEQILSGSWPFIKSRFHCTHFVYYNSLNVKTSVQNEKVCTSYIAKCSVLIRAELLKAWLALTIG